jgi:hypothetical protein
MHKDNFFVAGQNNIWPAGKVTPMQAESIS